MGHLFLACNQSSAWIQVFASERGAKVSTDNRFSKSRITGTLFALGTWSVQANKKQSKVISLPMVWTMACKLTARTGINIIAMHGKSPGKTLTKLLGQN